MQCQTFKHCKDEKNRFGLHYKSFRKRIRLLRRTGSWTPMNYKEKIEEFRQAGLQSVPVVPNGTIGYKERQDLIKQYKEEALNAKVIQRNIGKLEDEAR